MSEKIHERLSASGSTRWMNCPRCPQMEEKLPEVVGDAAQEGTDAHALGEFALKKDLDARNVTADDDVAEAVQVYLDAVREVKGVREVEKKYMLPWIHKDLGGTADCVVHEVGAKCVHVFDYKHGWNGVSAYWNSQLMIYGLAATHDVRPEECEMVRLAIVQPRAGGEAVRDWVLPLRELRAWGAEVLRPACVATDSPNAIIRAGDHCRYCRAKNQCPALKQHATEVARTSFLAPQLPRVEDLTPEQLEKVIHSLDLLQAWGKEAFAYALRQAEIGAMKFPTLKLVRKTSKRKWGDLARADAVLRDHLPREIYVVEKLGSITEVEKQLKARALPAKEIMEQVTDKPEGGYDLVDRDDRRPEIAATSNIGFIGLADVFA